MCFRRVKGEARGLSQFVKCLCCGSLMLIARRCFILSILLCMLAWPWGRVSTSDPRAWGCRDRSGTGPTPSYTEQNRTEQTRRESRDGKLQRKMCRPTRRDAKASPRALTHRITHTENYTTQNGSTYSTCTNGSYLFVFAVECVCSQLAVCP